MQKAHITKLMLFPVVQGEDFVIVRGPFFLDPEDEQACLEFMAIDDNTVEDKEAITVSIMVEGEAVGNVTLVIIDNDGMYS